MAPDPLYTADNCKTAYQLHWSVTLFAKHTLPEERIWQNSLSEVLEQDGIRILEVRGTNPNMPQLFVSSQPHIAPSEILRLVKGRWQYILRGSIRQLWQRNYSIVSVGDANNSQLQAYVANQHSHHPMADARADEILARANFHDSSVNLSKFRASAHGRYAYGLHVVFKNAADLADIHPAELAKCQEMFIAACRKKGWLLSRITFSDNHLHALLGCGMMDVPRYVGLSLMNNLAFAQGMKANYKFSFYVGTFGPYDHQAIRKRLAASSPL